MDEAKALAEQFAGSETEFNRFMNGAVELFRVLNETLEEIGSPKSTQIKHMVDCVLADMANYRDDARDIRRQVELSIKQLTETVKHLSSALHINVSDLDGGNNLESLKPLQRQNRLQQLMATLDEKKAHRLDELNKLKAEEEKWIGRLDEVPFPIFSEIPSDADLEELRKRIVKLHNDVESRQREVSSIRPKLAHLLSQLGIEHDQHHLTKTQWDVISADVKTMSLSDDTMTAIRQWENTLTAEHQGRRDQLMKRRQQIDELIERLQLEPTNYSPVRNDLDRLFDDDHGVKLFELEPKVAEVFDELNKQKLEHVGRFIEAEREKISQLQDKLFMGPAERAEWLPSADHHFTEELLAVHEQKSAQLETIINENCELLDLLNLWLTKWARYQQVIILKETNPNAYFDTRKNNLKHNLAVEKDSMTELPKIQQQLLEPFRLYEQRNGRPFLVHDRPLEEFFRDENDRFSTQLQEIKQQRKAGIVKPARGVGQKRAAPLPPKAPSRFDRNRRRSKSVQDLRELGVCATPLPINLSPRRTPQPSSQFPRSGQLGTWASMTNVHNPTVSSGAKSAVKAAPGRRPLGLTQKSQTNLRTAPTKLDSCRGPTEKVKAKRLFDAGATTTTPSGPSRPGRGGKGANLGPSTTKKQRMTPVDELAHELSIVESGSGSDNQMVMDLSNGSDFNRQLRSRAGRGQVPLNSTTVSQ